MMSTITRLVMAALTGTALVTITAPTASATPCVGKYDIVIGGFNGQNQDSQGFQGSVDQRVGYNSWSTRAGADELNRLIQQHRRDCPGDQTHVVAHSGGGAAAHVWAKENPGTPASIVLLADPKRPAGPGGPGFAATDPPFNLYPPLAGADANYGGHPTWQVCNHDDHVCNSQSSWAGYNTGRHGAYDFNVDHYAPGLNGQDYR